MLAFLRNIFRRWEIQRLERLLADHATEVATVDLVEKYREFGDLEQALNVARDGARRFPASQRIHSLWADLKAVRVKRQIEEAHRKLRDSPNPILYAKLAEWYKELGEDNRAIEICNAGIRRFPEYGGNYLVLGEVYLARYRQKKKNEDLLAAQQKIEKALQYNPLNYRALLLLAHVHLERGEPEKARGRLEEVLRFAPGDEEATRLVDRIRKGLAGAEAGPIPPPPLSAALHLVGGRGPAAALDGHEDRAARIIAESSAVEHDGYVTGLDLFKRVGGVLAAVLVDPYGLVVGSRIAPGLEEPFVGAMVASIFRTAQDASRKMNVGEFENGRVEGASGEISCQALASRDLVLGIVTTRDAKPALVDLKIKEYLKHAEGLVRA